MFGPTFLRHRSYFKLKVKNMSFRNEVKVVFVNATFYFKIYFMFKCLIIFLFKIIYFKKVHISKEITINK